MATLAFARYAQCDDCILVFGGSCPVLALLLLAPTGGTPSAAFESIRRGYSCQKVLSLHVHVEDRIRRPTCALHPACLGIFYHSHGIAKKRGTPVKALALHYRRESGGSAAIEFALLCPVLLLLLLGILAYGLYFFAAHSAAHIAANAARASVAGISDAEREMLARNAVADELKSHPIFLAPSKVVVSAGRISADPTSYRVAITVDAEQLPIWNLSPFLPLPSRDIEQSAVIKIGGY